MSKCFERVTKTIINEENLINGELENKIKTTEEKKYFIKAEGEEDFIKLYIKHIGLIAELPGFSSPILFELLKFMTYSEEGQMIFINPFVKEKICKKLKTKDGTIKNSLTELCKKRILFRVRRGIYQVNPHIFGKGTWNNIKKLRMVVDYDKNGIRLSTKITKEKSEKPKYTPEEIANILEFGSFPEEKTEKLNSLKFAF